MFKNIFIVFVLKEMTLLHLTHTTTTTNERRYFDFDWKGMEKKRLAGGGHIEGLIQAWRYYINVNLIRNYSALKFLFVSDSCLILAKFK